MILLAPDFKVQMNDRNNTKSTGKNIYMLKKGLQTHNSILPLQSKLSWFLAFSNRPLLNDVSNEHKRRKGIAEKKKLFHQPGMSWTLLHLRNPDEDFLSWWTYSSSFISFSHFYNIQVPRLRLEITSIVRPSHGLLFARDYETTSKPAAVAAEWWYREYL